MTPEAQRIAIAEACGWQRLLGDPWKSMDVVAFMPPGWAISRFIARGEPAMYLEDLPDYLRDLNAMHEAEGRHDFDMHNNRYGRILAEVVTRQPQGQHHITANWWTVKRIARATAAQRAEAFLRTLNLYTDDQ